MNDRRQVLVVARNPKLAERLVAWLADSGRATIVARTFADAKSHLDTVPDLVISELKLGAYNGLHLALKAQAVGVPAIVIGPDDPVLRKDAEAMRALYVTAPTRGAVLQAVGNLLAGPAGVSSTVLPFRARATTIAAEAELMWRAFSESTSELDAFGRLLLPN